ncbi:assembly of actin patch protein [Lithohypha guttulata]|uniref:Assembly of actin patch protein n=1 Tax=Lithohypha guttulata TaxID=1690604 RepID=A0AAN7ST81_9EURO|nr:assembly of actin patch protein [Lithohypha guttulata]
MTVPFKVKAVYEYKSEEPDDLNFENGQIITVTEDDDPDWYTGDYISSAGQKLEGIFPRNFVEKYEPAIPTRPARAPRRAPQPEPATEPEPSRIETKSLSLTAALPAAHEPSREAEIELPKQFSEPTPTPKVEPQPPAVEEPKTMTSKKAPPPVVEKPSSFKDRIAAFNKPAAAPVAPFKPAAAGQSFVKKPFVAPPPSRNAFVPSPREPPPSKVYRREEEPEMEEQEQEHVPPPAVVSERTTTEGEDQPKTETLKERIARLQAQQLENAQRQAESTKKKEKPKRPVKSRTESSDAVPEVEEEGAALERTSTERPRHEEEHRQSLEEQTVNTPPLPSRELVSDTNDADDSGAADTEDPQDLSTEEERPRPKSIKSPPTAVNDIAPEQEQVEEDTEEDEDPEIRRRRELRERMAKMSGGMGMMGMFGGGAGAASVPKRAKSTREDRHPESERVENIHRAPPVPIMALPGMAQNKSIPKPAPPIDSDEEVDPAIPTPQAHQEAAQPEEDYVSHRPSRRSTERSQPLSPRDRAPPPLPEARPEPLQSPGERLVPPPPPPTARAEVPPLLEPEDDDGSIYAKPLPTAISRAVPPPPLIQSQGPSAQERAVPPIPTSPISPQSRAPPPPPPGQQPPRRSTAQSSIVSPLRDDSEDEVTEYDGDYDTDIASSAKHKDARKSHHREASLEESTLSDDTEDRTSTIRAAPPPIPNIASRDAAPQRSRDSFDAPRAAPPPLPPTTVRPRESLDVPRAAPPPVPPPQVAPRESVELPRAAPPPVPQSPVVNDDYDPYRYSQQSLGPVVADLRKATDEYNDDQEEAPEVPHHAPPLMERAAPPLPPHQAHMHQEPESTSMSGALAAPPSRSIELGRSNSRRSTDVSRPSMDQGFIAADIDLAQSSMWWIRDNTPPPSLLNRSDVLWEVESSTTQKRGGRSSVSRDIYILYQDYSQSTVNATYDSHEPTHVSFEQSHSRPPMPPRKDQLESASESFGVQIAKSAEKALGNTIGEGTAQEFVLSLIRPLQTALLPIGLRSYGALVYANLANASTQQHDEIRPGDIITFRGAKFAGHKGGLHQKYAQDIGAHVAVVIDWDGTKKKIRAWEQGVQEKGKKSKVREESYRVGDLKSGEVRVWRVMPRSWVNWGSG